MNIKSMLPAFTLWSALLCVQPSAAQTAPTSNAPPVSGSTTPSTGFSAAVNARFPDIANFTLSSPAFEPGKESFPSDSELAQFVQKLAVRKVQTSIIGRTNQGRPLYLFGFKESNAPATKATARKLNIWIIGQQHGNEPAGGEAALELALRLTQAPLNGVLKEADVYIVPRANPDGAAANRRQTGSDTTSGGDMNRDHLSLGFVETVSLHRAMQNALPDLVLDLHEFTVGGRWIREYGVAQASDVLLQSGSHPVIAPVLKQLVQARFEPPLTASLQSYGLRSFTYHTLNTEGAKPFVQMGGNFAGIGRNAFALYGAVSFLLESRGIGLSRQNLQRRVASHVIAATSLMQTAVQNKAELLQAVAQARSALKGELIIDHTALREPLLLPMLDPESGVDKPTLVEFQNSLNIKPTVVRPVPVGYILQATDQLAVDRLRLRGVVVEPLVAGQPLQIEQYRVDQVQKIPGEFGAPQVRFRTRTEAATIERPAGAWLVRMNQPLARLAALALEPDSAGSFASIGVLSLNELGLSVMRLMQEP